MYCRAEKIQQMWRDLGKEREGALLKKMKVLVSCVMLNMQRNTLWTYSINIKYEVIRMFTVFKKFRWL